MSTNWAGASEGAIGVTLLRISEGVVFHFIIPGLHVGGGRAIPSEMRKHIYDNNVTKNKIILYLFSISVGVGKVFCSINQEPT